MPSNFYKMSLLPKTPTHRVFKIQVHGVPLEKDKLSIAEGVCYTFPLNIADLAYLPHLTWTTIRIGPIVTPTSEPVVWRTASKRNDLCVELEAFSDAGTRTMIDEARACWEEMRQQVAKRVKWMKLIGVHPQICQRMVEPLCEREIQIRTLHDDYLARMFAVGSAELARASNLLHAYEGVMDQSQSSGTSLQNFLWGEDDPIPDWAISRYDRALAGGYRYINHTFAPPELQAKPLNSKQ